MEPIKILLVGMPRLMADIIEFGLDAHPDMLIVGKLDSRAELVAQTRRTHPDFLVLDLDDARLPEECDAMFAESPHMRVLGLERDGAEAALYELRPRRAALGSISPSELAIAIRSANANPVRLWEVF